MTEPRPARLFVALDLSEGVRAALADWTAGSLAERDFRLIAPEHLHVTLCFLGWRDEVELEHICELTGACAAPVPELALAAPAWIPPRRPRLLAVDVSDPAGTLTALQARVSESLVRGIGYEPEKRPFWPHVTVARVRRGARVRPGELPPPEPLAFPGSALTVYRSHLARAGARYEPLARVAL